MGHPFDRALSVSDSLRARLADGAAAARWIVTDEGPGLSGSSLAAVVVLLEEIGASPDRIHLLPSHPGEPGPHASAAVRAAWGRVGRSTVTFDDLVLRAPDPAHRLEFWCADAVGTLTGPIQDISGGAWRDACGLPEAEWPPVLSWAERRKFLLRTRSGTWLARFAGLGRVGREKLDLAERLAEAGFAPPVAGLRHGFLIERWLEDATRGHAHPAFRGPRSENPEPIHADIDGSSPEPGSTPLDRQRPWVPASPSTTRHDDSAHPTLLRRLAEYLTFRAGLPPLAGAGGAGVAELFAMLHHNAGEALGPGAETAVDRWRGALPRFAAGHRPVQTDNRLQPWEWLRLGCGRLVKADAVDHWAGHDLIGCQDIAWDLAGAAVEFGLDADERAALAGAVAADAGRAVDPAFLLFNEASYCAFRLGSHALAAEGVDEAEAARHRRAADGYRVALETCLRAGTGLTVREGGD